VSAPAAPEDAVVATVHGSGAPESRRLDAVLSLVGFAVRQVPLLTALDELPRRIAAVVDSDICSLYLREGRDLVMRGNVGFTANALGEVRLSMGEGLTGLAVETGRPVSADVAVNHARYRHFPQLGEERFPAFLAVPLAGPQEPVGALVVQRARAYEPHAVELLAALSGVVSAVVERAKIVGGASRATPTASRRVTLPGRALVPGRALGLVRAIPRPTGKARAHEPRAPREAAALLERCLFQADTTLDMHARAARRRGLETSALEMHRTMLADARLRERALELCPHRGIGPALAQVASEATRTARLTGDPTLDERAQHLSELCDALRALALSEAALELPRDAVWIAAHMTVYDLLLATRRRPSGLVLEEPAEGTGRVVVELLAVPAVCEVTGLFRWASEGDVAIVDGDHGLVRLNPTRRERDSARTRREG
jgi:phosphotransferase system enzyme I (PtsP)